MARTANFFMPGEWENQNTQIERQRKLADLLQAQAYKMPEGNMVSGHYVAPNVTQYLAQLVKGWQGNNQQKQLDQQQKDAYDQRNQMISDAGQGFDSAYNQVDPMKSENVSEDSQGNTVYGNTPTVQNPQAALSYALKNPAAMENPMVRAMLPELVKGNEPVKGVEINGQLVNPTTGAPIGQAIPKQTEKKPIVVDGVVLDPDTMQPIYQAPQKPAAPTELEKLLTFRDSLPQGDPRRATVDAAISKNTTHAPAPSANVNVNTKQETEESKTVGKGFGEEYMTIQKAGMTAGNRVAKMTRLGNLLDGVNTGKLTPLGTEIAALGASLGVNIDPKLDNKQAAAALSNEISLSLRSTADGGGMPGAMSDQDREYLKQMVPNIGKTPGANKLMIDAAIKMAKRDQEVAQLARKYRAKNGHIDEGFYNELQAYSDSNPLFKDTPSTPSNSKVIPFGDLK